MLLLSPVAPKMTLLVVLSLRVPNQHYTTQLAAEYLPLRGPHVAQALREPLFLLFCQILKN
jgi:hypothetical protein